MKMKKAVSSITCLLMILLCGVWNIFPVLAADEGTKTKYTQISQEEAREMMAEDNGHIIVDVRTQEEFDAGHIPGAICIPNESIDSEQPEELPELDQIILVYCRSGRRSKEASQKLADIGYSNVYEFGGIIDWTGDVVTKEEEEKLTVTPTAVSEQKLSSAEKKKLRKEECYNPKYYDTPEEYADFIAYDTAMFDEEDEDWDPYGDLEYDEIWDDAYIEWKKANK